MRTPTPRRLAGLIAALSMTAALAACSHGGSDSRAEPAADRELSGGAGRAEAADRPASSSSPGREKAALARRHVISQGSVYLLSEDVAAARRAVQRVVDAAGGEVTDETTETDEDGEAAYTRLLLRVPSARFADTMSALEGVATLRSAQRTSEDVSTEVIDTGVRVRAQQASLRRVEQLLARAESLRDIIWTESQLTRRQAELDSLKAQQAWLADQTADATITVDVERPPDRAAAGREHEAGFLVGLRGGMSALGSFAAALATVAGAVLPFAVVGGLVGVPAWLLLRRLARRRRTTSGEASA